MKKMWWIKFITALSLILLINFPSLKVDATTGNSKAEVEAGIQFTEGSTSEPKKIEESDNVPETPDPVIKPSKKLPLTGEIMQPIVIMLIGWLGVMLIMLVFSVIRRKEEEDN